MQQRAVVTPDPVRQTAQRRVTMTDVIFSDVSFSYETGASLLLKGVTLHFPTGWTGVVGANGAGKTTVLRLATGDLMPLRGRVQTGEALYCAQRTDDPPAFLGELLADADGEGAAIRGRLGLGPDWLDRWDSLSHGERKRAQIGVALWQSPAILAVDEPSNHLDAVARSMLYEALRGYRGVGLLVSHDREMLDGLCRQCVFVEPPEAVMRPGGYSEGAAQAQLQEESTQRAYDVAKGERQRMEREAAERRAEAARADRRRSKRNLGKDNDARGKRNRARITGRDAVSGKLLRQMDGRLEQSRQRQDAIVVKKRYDLGIWVDGARSKRDTLLRLPEGELPLGEGRRLRHPALVMRPDDRVALTGPNGGGKSTLVRQVVAHLNLPAERVTYVPQEIDATQSREILDGARALPHDELGRMMTVVSCLGSRPGRLLESALPSPGELRKILLSSGIARGPHLIIMDEPTNHMDLPSIECLEEALVGCPCGLLMVSHDERFLRRLTRARWEVEPVGARGDMALRVAEAQ